MSYQNQLLGTIISSVLDYDNLCKITGDAVVINNATSSYVPCDGRSIISSELHRKTGMATAPDLRGRFMRGLNEIYSVGEPPLQLGTADPDGANRRPGDYQGDGLTSHSHSAHTAQPFAIPYSANGMGIQSDKGHEVQFGQIPVAVDNTGGNETRPRNVSLCFYLKIN